MRKTRFLGALLAGVMAVSGIPEVSAPLAVTISAVSMPTAVKNIKASPAEDTITLTWDKVPGADAYRVYYRDTSYDSSYGNGYKGEFRVFSDVTETSCKIDGLYSGRKYAFRIGTLVKSNGGYKEVAATSEKVVSTTIAAPSGISVRVGSDSVSLSWYRVSGADGYRIFRYNSKTKKYVKYKDVTETSCKITGLTAGKTYRFRIASLVKSSKGYKVQGKSSVITASPVKSESSGAPFKLPTFPAFGKSSAEVLKEMKASDYTIQSNDEGGIAYIISTGQLAVTGSAEMIYLMFNEKDQFYGIAYMAQVRATRDEIREALIKQNGESLKLNDKYKDSDYGIMVWQDKSYIRLAQFEEDTYSGGVVFVYADISMKYCTSEMKKQLKETISQYTA